VLNLRIDTTADLENIMELVGQQSMTVYCLQDFHGPSISAQYCTVQCYGRCCFIFGRGFVLSLCWKAMQRGSFSAVVLYVVLCSFLFIAEQEVAKREKHRRFFLCNHLCCCICLALDFSL